MSYVGVKFNNAIRKIAGMAIMDVAFSNTSINGVQNKVIKAKFDEITTFDEINGTGTTIGDKLQSLATAFNNLTNEQKFKSYIIIMTSSDNAVKLNCTNVSGIFGCVARSNSGYSQILSAMISNGTWYASMIENNTINTLDYSTATNATVTLYYPVATNLY